MPAAVIPSSGPRNLPQAAGRREGSGPPAGPTPAGRPRFGNCPDSVQNRPLIFNGPGRLYSRFDPKSETKPTTSVRRDSWGRPVDLSGVWVRRPFGKGCQKRPTRPAGQLLGACLARFERLGSTQPVVLDGLVSDCSILSNCGPKQTHRDQDQRPGRLCTLFLVLCSSSSFSKSYRVDRVHLH